MPSDEPVLHRYITCVAVLLARVAHADGALDQAEVARLHELLQRIDGLPASGIASLCELLSDTAPKLGEEAWTLCYRELKTLCDAGERRQVLRLLASEAAADGRLDGAERRMLAEVATALGVDARDLDAILGDEG